MDAQTAMDLFSKELLAYDTHVGIPNDFYYNLPYIRNYELTKSIPIANVSGNIIKFYQYRVEKPVVIFTDIVDTTTEDLAEENYDESFDDESEGSLADRFYDEDGNLREDLTEEEMAALLTADTSSDEDAETSDEAESAEAYDDEGYDDSYDDEEVYEKTPASATSSDEYDDDEVYDKAPTGASAEAWDAPEF